LVAYAPLLFWIGVIFYLSSSQGSFSETSRFFEPILYFLFPNASLETITELHGYIRKLAHVGVYSLLGLLATRAFSIRWAKTPLVWAAVSIAVVVTVASLDEFNQSFLATRTGAVADVVLDTVSGVAAIGIAIWWLKRRQGSRGF